MRIRIKKSMAVTLMAIIIVGIFTIMAICADAKMHVSGDNIYITHGGKPAYGWTWQSGNRYYCHKTDSGMYPKGSAFRGGLKLIGQKIYCFDSKGRQVRRDTRYVKLHTDKSVKYLYIPGTAHKRRYNTRLFRYQYKRNGKWITEEGMPYYPFGLIDTQG